MNELTPIASRTLLTRDNKLTLGDDVAALNNLVGFLNSPLSGGEDRAPGEASLAEAMSATLPDGESQAAQAAANPKARQPKGTAPQVGATPQAISAAPAIKFDRFFMTGKLCAGKDYLAAQTGASIEGISVPLYRVAEHFFGVPMDANKNKDIPGMRAFLQTIGQWGRGTISSNYPVTPARAAFIMAVRAAAQSGAFDNRLGVVWEDYGTTENLWMNAALVRLAVANPERAAITNVRFPNEFKKLTENGWTNWHIVTSPTEWSERLAKRGIKPDAPVLRDDSEKLAASLDAQVVREISRSKNGPKLRCVWNSSAPCPSPRLFTVAEFLSAANVSAATTNEDVVLTGE